MRKKQLCRSFVFVIAVLLLVLSACDSSTGQVDSSANTGGTSADGQPDKAATIAANQTAIAQSGGHQAATVDSGGGQIPTATREAAQVVTVDTGNGGVKEWSSQDIDKLLATLFLASKLEPLTPKKEVEEIGRSEDAQYRYITEKHNVIENRESVLYMGQNDAVLYPGAIIHGKDVYDFVYSPVITSRTPITLSLSLEGVPTTGSAIKETVDDPSVLSNVRQGVNNLLKSAITPNTKVPAKFDSKTEQVYSSEMRNLHLGVSGSYAGFSMGYDFDWSTVSKKNRIMSTYKQVYYTVDVDMPEYPWDFFDPSIGVDGLAAKLPPGSMPMYVSSVSYGWMAVLFVETNYEEEVILMALALAYSGAVDVELGIGYTVKEVLEESSIYILVYGGSTAGITSSTLSGYSGLMELIVGSKDFGADSPGVPISYTLRHLSDNLIAKIALTEEYTITIPTQIREFVKVTVNKFDCQWGDDGIYGKIDMDRLHAWVDLKRGADYLLQDVYIVNYWDSGDGKQWDTGSTWSPPNAQTVMMLDLENYPISSYNITLTAHARDWDECNPNGSCSNPSEEATNSVTINGNQIFDIVLGYIELYNSSSFRIWVFYTIEQSTYQEYCTYDSSPSFCYIHLTPQPN